MEEFEVEGRIIDEKRGTDGDRTRRSDIVRLLTGAVMLVIPFLGAWWELRVGDAFILSLDPFDPKIEVLGRETFVPMLYWLGFSLKLIVLLSGIFLILGSITERWWSVHFVRFGSIKLFWIWVWTLISILILSYMPLNLPFQIPLNGVSTEVISVENVRITFQIQTTFTEAFWIAAFASMLGIYLRFTTSG